MPRSTSLIHKDYEIVDAASSHHIHRYACLMLDSPGKPDLPMHRDTKERF
jgi:hypothetical protein